MLNAVWPRSSIHFESKLLFYFNYTKARDPRGGGLMLRVLNYRLENAKIRRKLYSTGLLKGLYTSVPVGVEQRVWPLARIGLGRLEVYNWFEFGEPVAIKGGF